MTSITLELDADDLMSATEALHESLVRRLKWLLDPEHPARDIPWEDFRAHLKWMVNAFYRMRIAYKDTLDQAPKDENTGIAYGWLDGTMALPTEVEQIFDQALIADSWDEFTEHTPHPVLSCGVCAFTFSAGAY